MMCTAEFLVAEPTDSAVRNNILECLNVLQSQEYALVDFRRHQRVALPVTKAAGMLLGIVTLDEFLVLGERENIREMQKLCGSEALN